ANNIFNILGAALATDLFLQFTGEAGVLLATAVMTVLVVIFAEVLPKTYAIRDADRFALLMAPAAFALVRVLGPVSRLLRTIVHMVLALVQKERQGSDAGAAVDELRARIWGLRDAGHLGRWRRQMLRGVLDLDTVLVRDVMTYRRDVVGLDVDSTVGEARAVVRASRYSRLPLWQGDKDEVVGVLHIRDVIGEPDDRPLRALMRPPWFVPETAALDRHLAACQTSRNHLAFVVDEHGTFMGLVTLEDILEEIVGEIIDERDRPVAMPEPAEDGSLTVTGRTPPRDLNRRMEWDLPEGSPTLSALLIESQGRIPEEGERIRLGAYNVDVVARRGHRLASLRITPAGEGDPAV
ncbi:MAG: DUF21 domain-containing protein, partial [Geminicoccaceae bacterium]|nr:DUF21 domain-containing protein [Geminicoccaceae bacterium]